MKKTKYYYKHYRQTYEIGDEALLSKNDLVQFYSKTKVKLHTEWDSEDNEQIGYTWQYAGDGEDLPQFFFFVGSVDVEIDENVIKFDESKTEEVNWQPNWKNLEKRKVG